MQKKFPFDDSLMIFRHSLENHILDQLREEFTDFQLSQAELPSLSMYKAADGSEKPRSGLFWSKIGEMKKLENHDLDCFLSCLVCSLFLVQMLILRGDFQCSVRYTQTNDL